MGEAATVEAGVEVVVRLRELDAMRGNSFPRNYRFGFNIFRSSSFFFSIYLTSWILFHSLLFISIYLFLLSVSIIFICC